MPAHLLQHFFVTHRELRGQFAVGGLYGHVIGEDNALEQMIQHEM